MTLDNAGVGLSTGQVCRTVRDLAVDTPAFLTALGLRQADVLGRSMGGFTARELALLRPRAVRRTVLAATAPRGGPGTHGYPDDVLAHRRPRALRHTGPPLRLLRPHRDQPAQRPGDHRPLPGSRARPGPPGHSGGPGGTVRDRGRVGRTRPRSALQRLTAIDEPVFVAGGVSDLVMPSRTSHLLAGLLPNARLKTYPDSGHGFLFRHHGEFARDVLAFLR
ncbi:alpha/beta hydrolase [Streptomyces flaveolus]|uniref:alpha/beta fold hydrolase n=1 Tax=Streptomyces flaveolus TaxID=67297 RepID=UPI0033A83E5F